MGNRQKGPTQEETGMSGGPGWGCRVGKAGNLGVSVGWSVMGEDEEHIR